MHFYHDQQLYERETLGVPQPNASFEAQKMVCAGGKRLGRGPVSVRHFQVLAKALAQAASGANIGAVGKALSSLVLREQKPTFEVSSPECPSWCQINGIDGGWLRSTFS